MLVRRIARPLLAASFIQLGIDTLRNPAPKVEAAAPLLEQGKEALPDEAKNSQTARKLPTDNETIVKVNAGVQVGGGLLLATGRLPRLASLALAGSLVPTTVAGHAFWEETDEASKAAQRTHFLKNLGLLGGLLLAAVDTEGKPSVAWRARKGAKVATAAVSAAVAGGSGSDTGDSLREGAQHAVERGQELAHRVADSDTTAKIVAGGAGLAGAAAARATDLAHTVAESDTTKRLTSQASDLADEGAKRGRKLARQARGNAKALAQDVSENGGKRARKAVQQAGEATSGAGAKARVLAAEAKSRADLAAAKAEVKAARKARERVTA